MKLAQIMLVGMLAVLSISAWVVILKVDARLKEAAWSICKSQSGYCSLVVFEGGQSGRISFYAWRRGKFYRFIRESK